VKRNELFHWVGWLYMSLIGAFIFAPVFTLALFSLHAGSVQVFPIEDYSLKWYAEVWNNHDIRNGLWMSAWAGVVVACLSTSLGFLSAHLMCRQLQSFQQAYFAFVSLPCLFPAILGALSMLLFYNQLNISGSIWLVVVGHTCYASPFAMAIIYTSYRRLNVERELAARNLGASRLRVFLDIVIPQLWPAIAAAAILAFLISWDDVTIAWFLGGFDNTLPVVLYGRMNTSITPSVNVVGVFVMTVSATGLAVMFVLLSFKK
jgi:spermidine/putrescine transport system permease protein